MRKAKCLLILVMFFTGCRSENKTENSYIDKENKELADSIMNSSNSNHQIIIGESLNDTLKIDVSNYSEMQILEVSQKSNIEFNGKFKERFFSFLTIEKALKNIRSSNCSGCTKITSFKYLINRKYSPLGSIIENSYSDSTRVIITTPIGTYGGILLPMFNAYLEISLINNILTKKEYLDYKKKFPTNY